MAKKGEEKKRGVSAAEKRRMAAYQSEHQHGGISIENGISGSVASNGIISIARSVAKKHLNMAADDHQQPAASLYTFSIELNSTHPV